MTDRPRGDDRGDGGDEPSAGDGAGGRKLVPGGLPVAPECPFCRSEETEMMSAFGAHASVATYWCRACRSPFDFIRWRRGAEPGAGRG